jgi:hypothetical protein
VQYGSIHFGATSATAPVARNAMALRHHNTSTTNDTFNNTIANAIDFTVDLVAAGSSLATTVSCQEVTIEILN